MTKIIVKLQGGLGNQMFQYAAGLALAKHKGTKLLADCSFFKHHVATEGFTPRKFELSVFEAPVNIASQQEREHFTKPSVWSRIRKKLKLNYPKIYKEPHLDFQQAFFELVPPVFLDGYFQSWKYVNGVEDFIRKQFAFRNADIDVFNRSLMNDWLDKNTVSIHIRRGDYVTDATVNSVHGACSVAYYKQAMEVMAKKVEDPYFIFFSDDITWAKENFSTMPVRNLFLDHNKGEMSWKDMMLMSHCHHHIIANSSFSWWAAWLNNQPNKLVVAPRQWFNDPNQIHPDLIPPEWIRI